MKNKKLKLSEFSVNSFVTNQQRIDMKTVKGGYYSLWCDTLNPAQSECMINCPERTKVPNNP